MLIVSIDDKEALTLYQSWWRYPEIMGIPKGSEEYRKLQKMWEEATGRKIEEDESEKAGKPENRRA
jgi:hypothetical protein